MDEKYFVAKITIDDVDSESGKIKKQKEEKELKQQRELGGSLDLMKKLTDYLSK